MTETYFILSVICALLGMATAILGTRSSPPHKPVTSPISTESSQKRELMLVHLSDIMNYGALSDFAGDSPKISQEELVIPVVYLSHRVTYRTIKGRQMAVLRRKVSEEPLKESVQHRRFHRAGIN